MLKNEGVVKVSVPLDIPVEVDVHVGGEIPACWVLTRVACSSDLIDTVKINSTIYRIS
jgi:hypothetical protein